MRSVNVAFAVCVAVACSRARASATDTPVLWASDAVDLGVYDGRVLACGPGQWSVAGSDVCECRAGFAPSGGECVACVPGKFKAGLGNSACVECPSAFMTSYGGASSATECVCLEGHGGTNLTCAPCLRDTYKPFAANVECVACPTNSELETPDVLSTVDDCLCSAGFTLDSSGDVAVCVPCGPGTYKDVAGNSACASCGANEWSPEGSHNASACVCGEGYTSLDAACSQCPAGTYKSWPGNDLCARCPLHSTSPAGSKLVGACDCVAGYYGQSGSNCSMCAAGTYKPGLGSTACTACRDNHYSAQAASECTACPVDTVLLWNASDLAATLTGSASDCRCRGGYARVANGSCAACAAGSFRAVSMSDDESACSACPAGRFQASTGRSSCVECRENSAPPSEGAAVACLCNAGYEALQSSCSACEQGKHKSQPGDHGCVECESGTYQDTTAAFACTRCFGNSTSEIGSVAADDCLCVASFYRDGDGCAVCSQGFFCPGQAVPDNNGRVPCPQNSTSIAGSDAVDDCECQAGMFFKEGTCLACPATHFCGAGTVTPTPCPASSTAPRYSVSQDACVCDAGFRPIDD